MKLKDSAIKELESLNPSEMMRVYEMIISLKTIPPKHKVKQGISAYMRVRNALKQCRGSLSEDLISQREDRV